MQLLFSNWVIPLRLERKTYCLEGSCSIQLSYGTDLVLSQKRCKDSANRMKFQIYLRISEVQPIFRLQSRLKLCKNRAKKCRHSEVEKIGKRWDAHRCYFYQNACCKNVKRNLCEKGNVFS